MVTDFPKDAPKRILITRADRIGDLVISTPVFKAVRERFPDASIAVLTFIENREIVQGNPFVDRVILYDKKGSEKSWWGNWRFARRLARDKFDLVIHLHATNRMHGVSWLAGIPCRIGWSRKAGNLLTHVFPDIKREGKKHEAEYNFHLLRDLGISAPECLETFFPLKEEAARSLDELMAQLRISAARPWLVLNPSASCPSKRWPAERFGKAASALLKAQGGTAFVIGTRAERNLADKVRAASGGSVVDLTGRLSLGMLGVLLKRADLLISNDSGPVHIASAVGTPVVSIFGRKQGGLSPTRWRPLGERTAVLWKDVGCETCLAHACQIHFLCLDAIATEEVVRAAESLLQNRKLSTGSVS